MIFSNKKSFTNRLNPFFQGKFPTLVLLLVMLVTIGCEEEDNRTSTSQSDKNPLNPEELGYYKYFKESWKNTAYQSNSLLDNYKLFENKQNTGQTEEANDLERKVQKTFTALKQDSEKNLQSLESTIPPDSMTSFHSEWLKLLRGLENAQTPNNELIDNSQSFLAAYSKFENNFSGRSDDEKEDGDVTIVFQPNFIPVAVSANLESGNFNLEFTQGMNTPFGELSLEASGKEPVKTTIYNLIVIHKNKRRYVSLAQGYQFFVPVKCGGVTVTPEPPDTMIDLILEVRDCGSKKIASKTSPDEVDSNPNKSVGSDVKLINSKREPVQFIRDYYSNINNREIDKAWDMLTPQFQSKSSSRQEFSDWWRSVDEVQVKEVNLVSKNEETAIVEVKSSYIISGKYKAEKPLQLTLVWSNTSQDWKIRASKTAPDTVGSDINKEVDSNPNKSVGSDVKLINSKREPVQFIRDYYSNINNREIDKAWDMLTPQFQSKSSSRQEFSDWWRSVDEVQVKEVNLVSKNEETAIVEVKPSYIIGGKYKAEKPLQLTLVWSNTSQDWKIRASKKF